MSREKDEKSGKGKGKYCVLLEERNNAPRLPSDYM